MNNKQLHQIATDSNAAIQLFVTGVQQLAAEVLSLRADLACLQEKHEAVTRERDGLELAKPDLAVLNLRNIRLERECKMLKTAITDYLASHKCENSCPCWESLRAALTHIEGGLG